MGVETLVAKTDIVFSGAIEGEQHSTSWFWPRHIIALKEQVTSNIENGPITAETKYEATIRRLP